MEIIACISVNDPFVMAAWGEAFKCQGKIRMLADAQGEFTKVHVHTRRHVKSHFNRQTDTHTHTHTDRQTDRQTDNLYLSTIKTRAY